jgi:hypothetical protein
MGSVDLDLDGGGGDDSRGPVRARSSAMQQN